MKQHYLSEKWLRLLNYTQGNSVEIYNLWSKQGILKQIIDDMVSVCKDPELFDSIATIATSGIIFAAPISYLLNKPLVILRSAGSIHHTKDIFSCRFINWRNEQDGLEIDKMTLGTNIKYLLIDDLVQTAKSLIAASNIIKNNGNSIVSILCFANISITDSIDGINIKSIIKI
jgi:adenine/guanine phosphoribosyltransferase-like PRPP-binding protein